MRDKILSGSKFQFKTWVFFNIRKILRLKRIVLVNNSENLFVICCGNFLK
jgi:hypothetical protein